MATKAERVTDGRQHRRAGRLTALGLSAALIAAGSIGYDIYSNSNKNNQKPEQTPQGVIAEPTPTPSETIIYTPTPALTPSPTESPSPTPKPTPEGWWNEIPPNPYKNINDVPLAKDLNGFPITGELDMTLGGPPPYYSLFIRYSTITDVIPNPEQNNAWIAVTTGGNRITRTDCQLGSVGNGPTIDYCKYEGLNMWLQVGPKVWVGSGNGQRLLGIGLDELAKYLKVGTIVTAEVVTHPNALITSQEAQMNMSFWNKIQASVGEQTPPRADRIFSSYVGLVNVDNTQ